MPEIKIDVKFTEASVKEWGETEKRAYHVFDRMKERGIGVDEIKEAIQKGAKIIESDGRITAVFKWYKVIYREFRLKDVRKVYPITVYAKI